MARGKRCPCGGKLVRYMDRATCKTCGRGFPILKRPIGQKL